MKMGVNGLGRVGRQVVPMAFERQEIEVVHINDVMEAEERTSSLDEPSVEYAVAQPRADVEHGLGVYTWTALKSGEVRALKAATP